MSFIETASEYMKRWFGNKDEIYLSQCIDLLADTCYKQIALQKATNLIAGCLTNTEIKTYEKKKEVKKKLYYALNISPNLNYNKYQFFYKLTDKLIKEQEVLIVQSDNQFFVADSFAKDKMTFVNTKFTNIVIDDYKLKETLYSDNVFYFSLANERLKGIVNSIDENYSKLINIMKNSYVQNRLRKIIVNFDTTNNLQNGEDNDLQNLIDSLMKPFIEGERNILTLPKGISLESLDNKNSNNNNTTIEEIKETGKEILEYIALILNIPLDIFYGNKAELKEQTKLYMTTGFKPVATMIQTEFTRKLYSVRQFIEGNYLKLDLNTTEYINVINEADGLDKLFRIGFKHNYIRDKLGEEEIDEEWANKSYITKNYMSIEGGEEIDEQNKAIN